MAMRKKMKKLMEPITIKGGYVPSKIIDIHEHLQEINRGVYYKRGYDRNKEKKIDRGDYRC